ncbi:MAG: hypothetical protein JW806_10245 [Sedimentisphaerales bacterium]|nr:hypothetical protein [Sedimentisphaerales bacterium]
MANYHLVILKKLYLDKILDGSKTVELRLTRSKCAPFDFVSTGDRLFFKQSSGPVCAVGRVRGVKQFCGLNPSKIAEMKREYNHLICGADDYWESKSDSRFATLVWLENIRTIEPRWISKKDWRAWVVLKKGSDFGLLDLASSGDVV